MTGKGKTREQSDILFAEEVQYDHNLVLYNDEVNSFDFVIDSLIEVCRHGRVQAEQCTYIVHYKGKCSVKGGAFSKLRPMCEALLDKGLTANIE